MGGGMRREHDLIGNIAPRGWKHPRGALQDMK